MLLLFFCGTLSAGGLKWEQTIVDLTANRSDKKVEGEFVFTNTTAAPVEIRSLRTSCGCTTAQLSKKVYQPGESGTVKVVFAPGGRKGFQEKTILVASGEKGPPDVLTLRVDIPDNLRINKKILSWQVGGPPDMQAFAIVAEEAGRVKVTGARALGRNFTAELEETEPGKTYVVKVRPSTTARPARGTVRVEVADPAPRALYLPVKVEE